MKHKSGLLQQRYTGQSASNYDLKRISSQRYDSEERAFSCFFTRVRPRSVIDCPFGTGRWIKYYEESGASVTAIDYSPDMLEAAKKKLTEKANVKLHVASIFNYDFSSHAADGIDLIVCTRFLNWICLSEAQLALEKLNSCGPQWAILGISVLPTDSPIAKVWTMKAQLELSNFKRRVRRQPLQYVHKEEAILSTLQKLNWEIIDKKTIFTSPTRRNYFYLLRQIRA